MFTIDDFQFIFFFVTSCKWDNILVVSEFTDAPFCKPNQTRVYGIGKNEIVNITCEVDANPTDLHFQWKFNNSADSEELPAELVNKSGTTISVVSHMPVLEVDYGTLLCSATNKVGRQRVPCVFHVIAAGKENMKV